MSKQLITSPDYTFPVGQLHKQVKEGFQSVAPVYEVTILLPDFVKQMFRTRQDAEAFISEKGLTVA